MSNAFLHMVNTNIFHKYHGNGKDDNDDVVMKCQDIRKYQGESLLSGESHFLGERLFDEILQTWLLIRELTFLVGVGK